MEFQENYPVDKLIPYARNSRTHNDEQIAQIAASIKEFGFTNPILIGVDDVIIACGSTHGIKRSSSHPSTASDRDSAAGVGHRR